MVQQWTLRRLSAADRELLRTATHANLNWEQRERVSYHDVDHMREARHYYELLASRGDFGFAAELGGLVVGAAWVQFFDAHDPGYGFVEDGVPELSLSVWSGYRGRGIGRALLVRAIQEAHVRGIERLSVSVEEGNQAVHLYRSVRFERAETANKSTYILRLD